MMTKRHYIAPHEVTNLFHRPTKRRRALTWPLLSAALLLGLGLFIFLNAPAVSQQLGYWWETDIQAANQPLKPTVILPSAAPTPPAVALANDTIHIPKIKVTAPIVWDVSAGNDLNTDMLKALERGVVRYPQTALPDQVGNVFLTGHSSNYWWEKGDYKSIFALINRLVAGDLIYVKYQNVLYTYKVTGQQVVRPTETSVLNPTKTPVLRLMTCTPVGTAINRRIVSADLVSPTESLKPQPTQPAAAALQSIR